MQCIGQHSKPFTCYGDVSMLFDNFQMWGVNHQTSKIYVVEYNYYIHLHSLFYILVFESFLNGSSVLNFLFYPTFTKTIRTPNFVKIPEKNILHVTGI